MRAEGKHILEVIEKYTPEGYDVADDMTVEFAIELSAKDRVIKDLRTTLRDIAGYTRDPVVQGMAAGVLKQEGNDG